MNQSFAETHRTFIQFHRTVQIFLKLSSHEAGPGFLLPNAQTIP